MNPLKGHRPPTRADPRHQGLCAEVGGLGQQLTSRGWTCEPLQHLESHNNQEQARRAGLWGSGPLTWSALQGLAGLRLAAWCETRLKWRTWAWDPGRHRRGHRGSWHQDPARDQSKLKP